MIPGLTELQSEEHFPGVAIPSGTHEQSEYTESTAFDAQPASQAEKYVFSPEGE